MKKSGRMILQQCIPNVHGWLWFQLMHGESARRQKIKTLAVLTVVLLTGYMLSSYWKMLVLWISLLQGITLAEGGDCMTER